MKRLYHRIKRCVVDGIILHGYRFRIPDSLIIEPTNICSLRCSCCPNGPANTKLRSRGAMTRETFDRIIANIDTPIKSCFLHLCGEPFLNENIAYFASKISSRGIQPIIFSNGYNIDLKLLDELLQVKHLKMSFSMELLSPDYYENIRRPGKYSVAVSSLEQINETFLRHKKFYGLNIITNPLSTEEELSRITTELFSKYSQLISISYSAEFPWPGLSNTGHVAGHLGKHKKICREVYSRLSILWNGDVAMCSLDYSGDTIIGNILDTNYSRLYNSRKARKFRRMHFLWQRHRNGLCRNCIVDRWENASRTIYRGAFNRLSAEERLKTFNLFTEYYRHGF